MTLAVRVSAGFALAAAVAYLATPQAIRLAGRLQFFDRPAGYKSHHRPTPYLGGLAVMGAFVLVLAVFGVQWGRTGALIGGALALTAVGTIDDRRNLSPGIRVVVELGLGVIVWAADLGWDLHAGGPLDLVLTCLWIVGVVNAFNLFDNMDGAAGTMALVVAAGVALIGVVRGDVWLAVAASCLCGACTGFLPRNMAVPARIFLGDGGSMPLGFAVAVLVMGAAGTSSVAWRSLLVALLLIGVPALDTSLVVFSRRRRGVSVLTGGHDHLTHRTRRYLNDARSVALALGAVQAALSVLAVLASRGEAALVVFGASAYLLIAGGAIIVLDTQTLDDTTSAGAVALKGPRLDKRALACLLVLGFGAGLSPFFFTYYDAGVWVPVGLGVALVAAVGVVLRPPRPAAPGALALAGLLGLGLWSLASSAWAESVENAVVSGNRILAYGALLLLLVVLVSHDRRAATVLGAACAGVLAVAISVIVRMLGSDPGDVFLNGRLNLPLGYINGEGCLFAMAVWPCAALLEDRRGAIAGAGAGGAALMACLALLTQSRGTALAMLGALVVVLALVPGRRRRACGLLVVAGAVALAGPSLLHVYDHRLDPAVPAHVVRSAAGAALLWSVVAGLAWGGVVTAYQAYLARAAPARAARVRLGAGWLLVVPVLVALVVGVARAHTIERDVSRQWHAFIRLSEPGEGRSPSAASQTRLLSGGGNRYDYWRIAWHVWRGHPLLGVGAGNYARPYYERRATTEDIDQPHSIWLQTLAETGLVGVLLLAAFVGGVAWAAMRMRAGARQPGLRRALLGAASGMFAAWLVQASVDWMALLPGLTAIALIAAAVVCWPRDANATETAQEPAARRPGAGMPRAAATAGVAVAIVSLIVAGASLSRQGIALAYRTRAEHQLAGDPAAALKNAERSLSIDSDAVQTYYLEAAALARFDEAGAAEAALHSALRREPDNFVTWALLGDVANRAGNTALARRDYERADRLNPRDPTLVALAGGTTR